MQLPDLFDQIIDIKCPITGFRWKGLNFILNGAFQLRLVLVTYHETVLDTQNRENIPLNSPKFPPGIRPPVTNPLFDAKSSRVFIPPPISGRTMVIKEANVPRILN